MRPALNLQSPDGPTHGASSVTLPVVLTIAGSDSGGGAGIQADLKTFAALDCHGISAVTAITAQNTTRVSSVLLTSTAMLERQIETLYEDFSVAAIKIGMLGDVAIIRAVAAAIIRYRTPHIVLDPVMVATSGDPLLAADALDCLRNELMPLASLVTPNLPEAALLLGRSIGPGGMEAAARDLACLGAAAVLLKGGHLPAGNTVFDVLVDAEGAASHVHPRLPLVVHGTGCTLASACAAYLARGYGLRESVHKATDFVHVALRHAFRPGRGDVAILNHFAAGRELA